MTSALPLEVVRTPQPAAALLDPTRQLLLTHLVEPSSAAALARSLGLPRQRVNYHLRVLEQEGLVELVQERRKGNCVERVVRATARSFLISPEALGSLGETPEAAYDRFSTAYLIAAAGRAIKDVAALEARARTEGKRLATFTIDADIRFASAATRSAFADELAAAVTGLLAKYHDDHTPGGRPFRVLATIHPTTNRGASSDPDEA